MRILVTNNHLGNLGGTETWVITVVEELVRRGFEVGVYTRVKGMVARMLGDYLDLNPRGYDIALINHKTCANVDAKKKIFTTHGWVSPLETPPPNMDCYVAVSENLSKKWYIDTIIKNPIDTELFKPETSIREKPVEILDVTTTGVPFGTLKPSREEYNIASLMKKADLVVTAGRGVLEAMSTARNVIVYDVRNGLGLTADGYLSDFTYLNGNVGGAYHLDEIDLEEELEKYDPDHGLRNREYILEHHAVEKIVDQYLNL